MTGVARTDRFHGEGPPDQRNAFAKDRDRVLYSTALRRLAGITQVVGAAEGHIFHNRLTHTLEVAQLSRRIAEKLLAEQPEVASEAGGIEPEVAEAAGLAHDLGHPPFGHIAEEELDRHLVSRHVADGFEGNAQSFRVLTRLSVRRSTHEGQNLTAATLNAVLKYPWLRVPQEENPYRHKKFGAFRSEEEIFEWARGVQPEAAEGRKSPEAEVMDWADDIAYAVHDMEDFFRAGFIPLHLLMDEDPRACEEFVAGTFSRWARDFRPARDEVSDDELRGAFENLVAGLREAQRIRAPYTGTTEDRANLRSLTSWLISRYVQGPTPEEGPPFRLRVPDAQNTRTVEINQVAEYELTMLKQLTWFYVIQRPSLAGQQFGQRRVVGDLFGIYRDAAESVGGRDLLPPAAKDWLEYELQQGAEPGEGLFSRLAADVVCGLSEQQAIGLHQRFTGVDPGSVLMGIAL
jgi:dGTPase